MSDDANNNALNDDDFLNAEPKQDQGTEQSEKNESEKPLEGEKDGNKEADKEKNKEEKKDDQPEGDEPKKTSSRDQRSQRKIARQDEYIGNLEAENAKLQSQLAELQGKQEIKELDPDDFDTYQDFLDAAAKQASELKQQKPQKKPNNSEQAFNEALADVMGDFDDARTKYKDFDDLVTKNDLKITQDMVICLADCEEPAELAYHLGKHPKLAEKLSTMSQRQIARELGKIESKLSAPPTKKQSKTPEPMGSIAGKGKQAAIEKASNDPDDEIL